MASLGRWRENDTRKSFQWQLASACPWPLPGYSLCLPTAVAWIGNEEYRFLKNAPKANTQFLWLSLSPQVSGTGGKTCQRGWTVECAQVRGRADTSDVCSDPSAGVTSGMLGRRIHSSSLQMLL